MTALRGTTGKASWPFLLCYCTQREPSPLQFPYIPVNPYIASTVSLLTLKFHYSYMMHFSELKWIEHWVRLPASLYQYYHYFSSDTMTTTLDIVWKHQYSYLKIASTLRYRVKDAVWYLILFFYHSALLPEMKASFPILIWHRSNLLCVHHATCMMGCICTYPVSSFTESNNSEDRNIRE